MGHGAKAWPPPRSGMAAREVLRALGSSTPLPGQVSLAGLSAALGSDPRSNRFFSGLARSGARGARSYNRLSGRTRLLPRAFLERNSIEGLAAEVYAEVRELASRMMAREREGHTLQPTALAHEAWLRLARWDGRVPTERPEFMALFAQVLKRVLIDHARAGARQKRTPSDLRVTWTPELDLLAGDGVDLLDLEVALERLAALSQRQARVVELRFFGGLSIEEIAQELDLSKRSIENDWTLARAFLRREVERLGAK